LHSWPPPKPSATEKVKITDNALEAVILPILELLEGGFVCILMISIGLGEWNAGKLTSFLISSCEVDRHCKSAILNGVDLNICDLDINRCGVEKVYSEAAFLTAFPEAEVGVTLELSWEKVNRYLEIQEGEYEFCEMDNANVDYKCLGYSADTLDIYQFFPHPNYPDFTVIISPCRMAKFRCGSGTGNAPKEYSNTVFQRLADGSISPITTKKCWNEYRCRGDPHWNR
jgi:hypothetical protein